jgi:hypothetical protein
MFSGQMGPRLAGLLDIPQITYAQQMTVEQTKVVSEKNLGEKSVTMESPFPVLDHRDKGKQSTAAAKPDGDPCVLQ